MDQWALKTLAIFHDPPHKPLVLGYGHAPIGKDIAKRIADIKITDEEDKKIEEVIKRADRIAAGADRENFLKEISVDSRRELTLIHPMDAATLAREKDGVLEFAEVALTGTDIDNARSLVEGDGFKTAFDSVKDPRLRYFLVWRFITDVLRELEGRGGERLGALWDVLPADTRMPNHPVMTHNSLVACLAPIIVSGQEPCLLRFTIGPVQPFIEAARSLADLWAGSYLLSRFIFEAMKPVFETHGPDSIVFPILRTQPLFDVWLIGQLDLGTLSEPLKSVVDSAKKQAEDGLRIPSLPNLFVAVVPWENAHEIARCCENRVREYVKEFASKTILESWPNANDKYVVGRAVEQWEHILEVHWSAARWPVNEDVSSWLSSKDAWPSEAVKRIGDLLEKVKNIEGYKPSGGMLYPVITEQSAIFVDAIKRDRLGGKSPREEGGLKCSMCGEREVLGGNDFYEERDLWRDMAKDNEHHLFVKEGDALCGVCLVKRLVGRNGPENGKNWRHPSTTEVATSRLKLDIILRALHNDDIHARVVDLERLVQRLPEPDELRVFASPAVHEAARGDGTLDEFAHLDGSLLLAIKRGEIERPVELERARKRLLDAIAKERPARPSPYLAVVVFDGDEVGKWLSGEKAPSVWEMLHPKAQRQIAAHENILRGLKRPVTPAIHAAISQICSSFARHAAPWTIEREGLPGHLVYAGGDDVLFLAPPLDALRLVWRLRLRYSGCPGRLSQEEDPEAINEIRPWFRTKDGQVVLAFGKHATASAGMCVFHAKDPLGLALEQARKVEKKAKGLGRNALGIAVLRRSGQESQAVIPFDEIILHVLRLTEWFANHEVSRSLHVTMAEEFAPLSPEDAKNEQEIFGIASHLVSRIVDRRLIGDKDAKAELKKLVSELGDSLMKLAQKNREIRVLQEWSEIVSIAEFLARPFDRREEE